MLPRSSTIRQRLMVKQQRGGGLNGQQDNERERYADQEQQHPVFDVVPFGVVQAGTLLRTAS